MLTLYTKPFGKKYLFQWLPFIIDLNDQLSSHALVHQAMYTTDCVYLWQTFPILCKFCVQKLLIMISKVFLIFDNYCQHTIILALLTNNILISFDHTLYNLKYFLFLIVSLGNIYKPISLLFPFGLTSSFSGLSLCFYVLFLICISLLPLFPKFKLSLLFESLF